MDITNFMQWFIQQVVSMFTQLFGILEDIEFMNTNLLQVCVTIIIISAIIPILLTIGTSVGNMGTNVYSYNERVKTKNKTQYEKASGK